MHARSHARMRNTRTHAHTQKDISSRRFLKPAVVVGVGDQSWNKHNLDWNVHQLDEQGVIAAAAPIFVLLYLFRPHCRNLLF